MTEIKLTKRYPHSRTEDITDAFMRGYEIGKEQEHRWWSAFCANCKTEPSNSEKPNNCETCRFDDKYGDESICSGCSRHYSDCYEPKDEPQTEDEILREQCRAFMGIVEQTERAMTKEIRDINTRALDFVVELIEYIFEYPDDDYMTMECLCRKLFKYGLIEKKDGEWTTDFIDRKTENSSEIPNNCEHITEDGVTCAKYPACDDCLDNPLNKVKGSERLVKGSEVTTDCRQLERSRR